MKSNWKISFLLFIFVLFFLPGYERHHHVFIPGSVWRVGVSWSSCAVTPRSDQLVTLQLDIKIVDCGSIYHQLLLTNNFVEGCGEASLPVSSPGGISLVVAFSIVPLPVLVLVAVQMPECSLPASPDPCRPLYSKVSLPHPHEELVILQPPPPVLVTHPVHLLEVVARDEEDPSYEGGVVILGVKLIGGEVKRSSGRIAVEQGRVLWEQIHIMHGQVVTAGGRLMEAYIDQVSSVEPELVCLVNHPNLMLHSLIVKKCFDIRSKL